MRGGVYEITDVYTDGTVAASFGTPGTDTASGGAPTLSMSLAAFANSEGLTFVAAMSYSATSGMTFETSPSYTELADGTPGGVSIQLAEAYYGGEDNTVDVAMTGYTQHAGIAVEMVGIAAGGGVVTFRRRLED